MSGFFDASFTDAPAEPLTQDDIVRAIREVQKAFQPERPARIVGRKYDVYDLLIDMGCSFDRTSDGLVPVPVSIGALSMDVVTDEQSPPGMVREEFADGRTGRTYLRSPAKYGTGASWFVISDGAIIDQFRAGRADAIDAPLPNVTTSGRQEQA